MTLGILLQAHLDPARRRLDVCRSGQPDPLLTQHADPDHRPFIHPIRPPDGVGVLTENAPPHHPWQHGLYVGLNGVNGVGFWKEDPGKDGSFHPAPIVLEQAEGDAVAWAVETEWRAPDGQPLLTETQRWRMAHRGDACVLDLEWSLCAATDLTFGRYAYGGPFLRMPYRAALGGRALNSEGQENAAAEAQRARWVAVSMPIEGREDWAGIAVLDHPANPEHPVPWRVDGQFGIAPSRCIAGSWELAEGQTARFRHRLLAYAGPTDARWVEARWQEFAEGVHA